MHLGTFSLLSNVAPFFSKLVVAPLLNVRVIFTIRQNGKARTKTTVSEKSYIYSCLTLALKRYI